MEFYKGVMYNTCINKDYGCGQKDFVFIRSFDWNYIYVSPIVIDVLKNVEGSSKSRVLLKCKSQDKSQKQGSVDQQKVGDGH